MLQIRGDALRQGRADLRGQALETLGVAATAIVPAKLAIDFESAMADVKKVVDFDEPQGFQKLGETIKEMSRTLPLTANELAAITASGGQLGVKAKDLPLFAETIAKMATAFDMGAEEAGDSMAKLANVYNIPIKQIGRLGDAINQLSNESPAKARDIVSSLGRVGGVAKEFGLTEIQAASLANAFVALGKPPEVAATAINGMLVKLQTADKQGPKFQKALAAIGTDAGHFKKLIAEDAQGALLGFLKALEGVPKDQRMGLLVDLFGLEYADDVAVLAGSLDTYAKSIDAVKRRGKDGKLSYEGSMEREFSERANTTGNNLKLLKNSLAELGINIGAAVLPGINALVNDLKPLIWGFATWAKEHPGLISGLLKAAGALLGLRMASIVTRYGFSLLGSGTNSLLTGFHLLHARGLLIKTMFTSGFRMATLLQVFGMGAQGAVTWAARLATLGGWLGKLRVAVMVLGRAFLMTPIGLAIGAAALLIYKFWGPIKGFFIGLWQGLKEGLAPLSGAFRTAFAPLAPILRPLGNLLAKLWGWFSDLMTPIEDTGGAAQSFGRKVGNVVGFIVRSLIGLPLKIASLPLEFARMGGDIITGLVSGVTAKLAHARDTILKFGQDIKGWFSSTLGIKSPSRVFMGFGDNIAQGAAIGITRSMPHASRAAGQMAQSTVTAASRSPTAGRAGASAASSGGHTITVHLQQTFNLSGTAGDLKGQLQEAGRITERELERTLDRLLRNKLRMAN